MTDRNLPVLQLSPEHMSPEEQFEAMRVSIKPVVDLRPIRHAESDPFKASSTWYLLDNIAMSKSSYSALRYQRDSKKLKQNDDIESYIFHLSLNGSHIGVSGGQELRVNTGGIAVLDTREEIYGQSGDCDLLTVMMPRHLLEKADQLHATLPANCIKTRVLREHMLSLWHALPEIEVTDNSAFSRGLVSLTNALFSTEGTSQDVQVLDISLLTAMKNSIEKNLGDTRLGVHSLCKEFYCSRAKLYRLFQSDGGVARYIRERRLVTAFKYLSNHRMINKRIIDVAIQHGFTNQSMFSRLFRQHFGVTPSDVVMLSAAHPAAASKRNDGVQTAQNIAFWLKSL